MDLSPSANLIDANCNSGAPLNAFDLTGGGHVREAPHTSIQTADDQVTTTTSATTDLPQPATTSTEENPVVNPPSDDSISTARRHGERNQYPTSGMILPEEVFRGLVHEILATHGDEWKIQDSAMKCVQEACEVYMLGVFESANIEATKDNQVTVTANHITLGARKFAREMFWLEHYYQRQARMRGDLGAHGQSS